MSFTSDCCRFNPSRSFVIILGSYVCGEEGGFSSSFLLEASLSGAIGVKAASYSTEGTLSLEDGGETSPSN